MQNNKFYCNFIGYFSRQIEIHANNPNINANIFFGIYDNDNNPGRAYPSTICSSKLTLRIGIVEWIQTDIHTGEVRLG